MSIVLFLALPISALVVIDYLKLKSELQYEIRQLKKLKKELKENHEKANTVKPSTPDGLLR
jgi:cell shape-determining protein MreC